MTNFNERLDELEEQFLADYRNWNDGPWDYNGLNPKQKFQQALTSLIKELVAEAKIDPFEFVESCEPDCDDVRHAYHLGQLDMAIRIKAQQEEVK